MDLMPDPLPAWQDILDKGAEAGQIPLIGLGMRSLDLYSLPDLAALRWLARRRLGPRAPHAVIGGDGSLWLLTLLQAGRTSGLSPTLSVGFGGADVATYAASLDLLAPRRRESDHLWGRAWLSPGMQWLLGPASQPGSGATGPESLPFVLDRQTFSQWALPSPRGHLRSDRLFSWAAWILVVALLAATLFV
jgi:hypothetical protein